MTMIRKKDKKAKHFSMSFFPVRENIVFPDFQKIFEVLWATWASSVSRWDYAPDYRQPQANYLSQSYAKF